MKLTAEELAFIREGLSLLDLHLHNQIVTCPDDELDALEDKLDKVRELREKLA